MTYIPAHLRTLVVTRAGESCEYCLVHADYAAFKHEVDHIIKDLSRNKFPLWPVFAKHSRRGADRANGGTYSLTSP